MIILNVLDRIYFFIFIISIITTFIIQITENLFMPSENNTKIKNKFVPYVMVLLSILWILLRNRTYTYVPVVCYIIDIIICAIIIIVLVNSKGRIVSFFEKPVMVKLYIPFQVNHLHGQTEPVPRRMRATLTETEPVLFYANYQATTC